MLVFLFGLFTLSQFIQTPIDLYTIKWATLGAFVLFLFLARGSRIYNEIAKSFRFCPEIPLLIGWCLISSIASRYKTESFLTTLTFLGGFIFFYVALPSFLKNKGNSPIWFLRTYLLIAVPFMMFNLLLLLEDPSYLLLKKLRFTGTMERGGYVGVMVLPVLLSCAALALKNRGMRKLLLMLCSAIAGMIILATNARSAWVGAVVGLLILFAMSSRKALTVTLLLALLTVSADVTINEGRAIESLRRASRIETDFTTGRMNIWESSMYLFEQAPIWGVGLKGQYLIFSDIGIGVFLGRPGHSSYVAALVELGVVGFLLFILTQAHGVIAAWRNWSATKDSIYASIVAILVSFMVISIVEGTTFGFGNTGSLLFWGLSALSVHSSFFRCSVVNKDTTDAENNRYSLL